jgi:dihydrofolate reductase
MRVTLVVAAAKNDTIGDRGKLPWRLPDDLRRFKALTVGHHVVMGRKTWQSIGKPLPDRTNVVVSRDRELAAPGAVVVGSLDDALALARNSGETELFVIGGGELYRAALPLADRIQLTRIDADVAGDVRFPPLDADAWVEVERSEHAADERHAWPFAFVVLDRRR